MMVAVLLFAGVVAATGFAVSCTASAEPSREEKIRAWNEVRALEKAAFQKNVAWCREKCKPFKFAYSDFASGYVREGCTCSSGWD